MGPRARRKKWNKTGREGKKGGGEGGTVSRCIYAGVSRVQRDMRLQVAGKGRREASR